MKTYLMGGTELTEEQRKSVEAFNQRQAEVQKQMSDNQIATDNERNLVNLEQLFNTKVDPWEDRVVVFPDPVALVTEGGIIKPQEVVDKESERPTFGTIVAVGPGKDTELSITNKLLLALVRAEYSDEGFDDITREIAAKETKYTVGMRVMFGRFAGTPVQDPDTKVELLIMRPGDIFGRIKQ